jgi:hypothetical protein
MPTSVPLGASQQPISTFGHSMFYMQIVLCPNSSYYYNYTLDLCILCISVISNCDQCLDGINCTVCASSYILNPVNNQCVVCPILNCINCVSYTKCQLCDYNNNYSLSATVNNTNNCIYCDSNNNMFIDYTNTTYYPCIKCLLPVSQCSLCYNLSVCLTCNNSNNYFMNNITGLC